MLAAGLFAFAKYDQFAFAKYDHFCFSSLTITCQTRATCSDACSEYTIEYNVLEISIFTPKRISSKFFILAMTLTV